MKLLKTNFHIIIGLITVLTIICKKCSNTIRTVKEDTSPALPKIDNADDVCRYAIGTLGQSSSSAVFKLNDFDMDKIPFNNCILIPKVIYGKKSISVIRGKKAIKIIEML